MCVLSWPLSRCGVAVGEVVAFAACLTNFMSAIWFRNDKSRWISMSKSLDQGLASAKNWSNSLYQKGHAPSRTLKRVWTVKHASNRPAH